MWGKKGGTYQPTREKFPLMDALAMAVAVDRENGFIKSGQGYFDPAKDCRIEDNRAVCLNNLRYASGIPIEEGKKIQVVNVTDTDCTDAEEIFSHFDQSLLMQKLGDDYDNDFNKELAILFGKEEIDVNKELAMLASMPNSRRVSIKRDEMTEFYRANQNVGSWIGDVKQRMKVSAYIQDVKFIPRNRIYLVVGVTASKQIVKFFLDNDLSDVADALRDKDITFVGTVKKQEVNDHSNCHETVFNRVKIQYG